MHDAAEQLLYALRTRAALAYACQLDYSSRAINRPWETNSPAQANATADTLILLQAEQHTRQRGGGPVRDSGEGTREGEYNWVPTPEAP